MGCIDPIREASLMSSAMDIVYIEGLTGETLIGIDESELRHPQPVRLDLAIGVPSIRACKTDRIDDTINYAAVREAILTMFASHRVQLLEALAEQIAQLVIADFAAHWVRVSLAKPAKFIDVVSVGCVIERSIMAGPRPGEALDWMGRGFVPQ